MDVVTAARPGEVTAPDHRAAARPLPATPPENRLIMPVQSFRSWKDEDHHVSYHAREVRS